MVFIYILQLEQEKYYIGKTTNPSFRIDKHFYSDGSFWTKKYKPVSLLELIPNCDAFDEDKHTIKYMEKYGINNVRGGSFCEIKLSDNNTITLNQMIKGVTDKCYICGKDEHFANECKKHSVKKTKVPVENVNDKCDCPTSFFSSHRRVKCLLNNIISYFEDEDDDIEKLLIKDNNQNDNVKVNDNDNDNDCFRCGRKGHYISSCYATKHIKGYFIK